MIFIDSNIWCYYFDSRVSEHKRVIEPVREALREGAIFVNTVVIMEVAHYLSRYLSESDVREKVNIFVNLRNLRILDFDRSLLDASVDLLARFAESHGLGGRDATIVASLIKHGINVLVTHDKSLGSLVETLAIKVQDPIPT